MCGKTYHNDSFSHLKSHMTKHVQSLEESYKHVCHVCGKRMKFKSLLECHILRHNGVKQYECTVCDASFVSNVELKGHIRRVHEEKRKLHLCHLCGQNFSTKTYLNVHSLRHNSLKPFKCYTCGDKFRSKAGLNCHKYRHTHKKPYNCQICGKGFIQIRQIKTHMMVHHNTPYMKAL